MINSVNRLELALVLVTFGALLVSGCAGMLALAGYAAVASEIDSLFEDDEENPGYTLFGTVYVDRTDSKIAISSDQTPPDTPGNWERYSGATITIDTTPPRSTTTDGTGYFIFRRIPDSRIVLTVEAPNGTVVNFNVRLDSSSIEPAG